MRCKHCGKLPPSDSALHHVCAGMSAEFIRSMRAMPRDPNAMLDMYCNLSFAGFPGHIHWRYDVLHTEWMPLSSAGQGTDMYQLPGQEEAHG